MVNHAWRVLLGLACLVFVSALPTDYPNVRILANGEHLRLQRVIGKDNHFIVPSHVDTFQITSAGRQTICLMDGMDSEELEENQELSFSKNALAGQYIHLMIGFDHVFLVKEYRGVTIHTAEGELLYGWDAFQKQPRVNIEDYYGKLRVPQDLEQFQIHIDSEKLFAGMEIIKVPLEYVKVSKVKHLDNGEILEEPHNNEDVLERNQFDTIVVHFERSKFRDEADDWYYTFLISEDVSSRFAIKSGERTERLKNVFGGYEYELIVPMWAEKFEVFKIPDGSTEVNEGFFHRVNIERFHYWFKQEFGGVTIHSPDGDILGGWDLFLHKIYGYDKSRYAKLIIPENCSKFQIHIDLEVLCSEDRRGHVSMFRFDNEGNEVPHKNDEVLTSGNIDYIAVNCDRSGESRTGRDEKYFFTISGGKKTEVRQENEEQQQDMQQGQEQQEDNQQDQAQQEDNQQDQEQQEDNLQDQQQQQEDNLQDQEQQEDELQEQEQNQEQNQEKEEKELQENVTGKRETSGGDSHMATAVTISVFCVLIHMVAAHVRN